MLNFSACRVFTKIVVALPVCFGPYGSGGKSATIIRANIFNNTFHAIRAKGAFVSANSSFQRFGRQRFAAVFANRSELQHLPPFFVQYNLSMKGSRRRQETYHLWLGMKFFPFGKHFHELADSFLPGFRFFRGL